MGADPFHVLLVVSIVSVLIFGGKIPDITRWLADGLNNLKGPRGGPLTHPLPVTGPIETSKPKRSDQ